MEDSIIGMMPEFLRELADIIEQGKDTVKSDNFINASVLLNNACDRMATKERLLFEHGSPTHNLLCQLSSLVGNLGSRTNFADMQHLAQQFTDGQICLPQFIAKVQCTPVQLEFIQQFLAMPTSVYGKLSLVDWDEAVEEVYTRFYGETNPNGR